MTAASTHSGDGHPQARRRSRAVWFTVGLAAFAMVCSAIDNAGSTPTSAAGGAAELTDVAHFDLASEPVVTVTATVDPPAAEATAAPEQGGASTADQAADETAEPTDGTTTRTTRTVTRTGSPSTTRATATPTSTAGTPSAPVTTTTAPTTTTADPTPSRPMKPCKVGCVLVRQRFEGPGTEGWTSSGRVEPATGGASGQGSLHVSGLTTSAGPSLELSDQRLSGAARRWVSVSLRVRVDDPDGARLRLRVDGATKARVRELAADGRWRTIRAWFLPDGPVTLRLVAAPSSCSAAPTVTDVRIDDLVVAVTTPELALSGQASPAPVCW